MQAIVYIVLLNIYIVKSEYYGAAFHSLHLIMWLPVQLQFAGIEARISI